MRPESPVSYRDFRNGDMMDHVCKCPQHLCFKVQTAKLLEIRSTVHWLLSNRIIVSQQIPETAPYMVLQRFPSCILVLQIEMRDNYNFSQSNVQWPCAPPPHLFRGEARLEISPEFLLGRRLWLSQSSLAYLSPVPPCGQWIRSITRYHRYQTQALTPGSPSSLPF